jgi:hypothetical protein
MQKSWMSIIETIDGDLSTSARPLPGSYLCLRASCSRVQDWGMRPDLEFNQDPYENMADGTTYAMEFFPSKRNRIAIDLDSTQHRSLFFRPESNIFFLLILQIDVTSITNDRQLWYLVIRSYYLYFQRRYVRLGVARMLRGRGLPEPEWEERLVKIY